jgi:hypothetical protein
MTRHLDLFSSICLRNTHLPSFHPLLTQRLGMHQSTAKPLLSFALPHHNDSAYFLAMEDQSDVCSLSCRVMFQPVSGPLQPDIRFSDIPNSHRHRQALPPAVPEGSDTRFPRSVCEVRRVRCLLSTGRLVGHENALKNRSSRLHSHFGSSVKATSACSL